ncbi:MAG: DMT family transporter [Atopobiaceae bacterium]|nr:DMT family transporter [Atopobiaceae bacterium]MCI1497914.1 DMT family transporter [Atopobiaceae bacterium]MCI1539675.1 DMT family transporter [Atopobiaceae bacterium]
MLAAAVLFSFTEISLKELGDTIDPVELNFSRYLLAGIILLPAAVQEMRKRGARLTSKEVRSFLGLGFVGVVLVGPFYQLATMRLGAAPTSVLFSVNPAFIAVFAALMLHEGMSPAEIVSLAFDVLAVLAMMHPGSAALDPAGLILLVASVASYGLYAVAGKRETKALGSIAVTSLGFVFGGAELLALALLSHVPAVGSMLEAAGLGAFADIPLFAGYSVATAGWVILLYLGITLGAYLLWFLAMEHGSCALGGIVYFIKPALSPVLAWLILAEPIGQDMAEGMALMLAGAAIGIASELHSKDGRTLAKGNAAS